MPIFFSHEASPFREGCQSNRISQIVRGRRPGKAKNIRKCPQMCIASMPCNSSLKKPKLNGEKSKLYEFTSAPPRMWHVCQCLGVSFNNLIGGHPYIIFITFGCLRIELVKWKGIVGAAFGMLADISGSGRSFFCSAACCSLTNIRDTTISPNISLAILSALPPLHHCHLVSASLSRSMESKEKVLRVSCKSCPDWKWPFELLSPIAMMMMMTMVISMHKTMMVTVTVMVRDWKRFFEFLSVFSALLFSSGKAYWPSSQINHDDVDGHEMDNYDDNGSVDDDN